MTTQQNDGKTPEVTPPATPPAESPDEVLTLKKADFLKLIEDERADEAKKHLTGFSKVQSERDRYKSQAEEFKSRAELAELSPEDLAAYKNVKELIGQTAKAIGKAAGLTAKQVELMAKQPTMELLNEMADEFQASKAGAQGAPPSSASAEPSLAQKLTAIGANRGATPGNAGTRIGPVPVEFSPRGSHVKDLRKNMELRQQQIKAKYGG